MATYDGNGLRQFKTTGDTITAFTRNDSCSLPLPIEQSVGGTNTYYMNESTGLPLEEIPPDGSTYHYSADDLGSTRVLTDSSGNIADTDAYDPYGNLVASTGTVQNNLLFCGQYMDTESGLYYLQARYYDPATGQFTSVDPLVELTQSPYSYAVGDPLNETDPSGECGLWGANTCFSALAPIASAVSRTAGDIGALSGAIAIGCLVVGAAASETFIGGVAGGACATVAGAITLEALGIQTIADADLQLAGKSNNLPVDVAGVLLAGYGEVGDWALSKGASLLSRRFWDLEQDIVGFGVGLINARQPQCQ